MTAFLRNVYLADDHSSFVRWNRVFFRIMKPICAARTANVKVNEGFWTRAVGNIYSANFTVKFPLCRKREMGLVVLRPTCPLSPLYAPRPDFLSDLSSHPRPLFRHYLMWTSLLSFQISSSYFISPSFLLLEPAICHSRYPLREQSLSRFSIVDSSARRLVSSLICRF